MLTKTSYVPVIKWKRGERGAIEDLDPNILANITPLIEVQPIPYYHKENRFQKTIDQHLEKSGQKLAEFWKDNRPIFIDFYTFYDDKRIDKTIKMSNGMAPLEYIIDDIENEGIPTIIVTTLSRPSDFTNSVKNCLAKFKNDIAIRIPSKDLLNLSNLKIELDELINRLKIPIKKVHIFIDLAEIQYSIVQGKTLIKNEPISKYINEISSYINSFPYLTEWNTFTLLSTSVIDNFSSVPVNTNTELPRLEWRLYQELVKRQLNRTPNYGDYNVTSPNWFDFNPQIMPASVIVKYTVNNKFLIFKGVSINSKGNAQIYDLCQKLIKHSEYCGRSYSAGDEFIYQCGTGLRFKPGNPETRVRYWVNHHLTLVSNCLTNLHVSVTP